MARIWQNGFEFNSVTTNLSDWSTISGSPTVGITNVRSGTYAGRISSLASATPQGFLKKYLASTAGGPYFLRVNIYIVTYPSAANHIISFNGASGTAGTNARAMIKLTSTGTLQLFNATTQIGSDSAALSLNTWYMIELKIDGTPAAGSKVIEGRLEGSVFATSSVESQGNPLACSVGGNLSSEAQTTGEWWFDDIALNDSTGSFQTSYPGSGKIIHLKPSAAGDSNAFTTQTGGTAGSTNNFTRVNEVPPDDATSFNGDNTLNDEDLFNMDNSGIGSGDTVNVVMAIARFRNNVADAVTTAKLEIEKTSAGTILQGSSITPNTTSFNTNGTAEPRLSSLITYQDPDGSAWTQTTLDSMQLGYKITTGGTNRIDFTNIVASVDYTPASTPTNTASFFPFFRP